MMVIKIWKRYFLKEILQVFFLFLFCFYSLYVLIDYTNHAHSFHHQQNSFAWDKFFIYYGSEFVHRSHVLVPFALLIATVRTLTKLNQSHELTALRAAGVPLSTLMRPFVYVGLFFTLLLFVNEEWLLPKSMNALRRIQDSNSAQKRKVQNNLMARHLVLQDESSLIFQHYDSAKGLFFDAYWVRSADEIFRIKSLDPHRDIPIGTHVDLLARNKRGQLIAIASDKEKHFPDMVFNKKTLLETITPFEDLPLTKLWEKWPENGQLSSDKEAQVMTVLYKRLAAPWLCLLAVIAPIPLCVRFGRHVPVFFLYAINIFGLVVTYLILDSAQVLGKRQILDPALVIWGPFLFFSSIFAWRFYRLK